MAKSYIRYVESRYKDFMKTLESEYVFDSGYLLMILAENIKNTNNSIIRNIPICYLRDTIGYLNENYLSHYKLKQESDDEDEQLLYFYRLFYLKELIHSFEILLIKKKAFDYSVLKSMFNVLRCSLN